MGRIVLQRPKIIEVDCENTSQTFFLVNVFVHLHRLNPEGGVVVGVRRQKSAKNGHCHHHNENWSPNAAIFYMYPT